MAPQFEANGSRIRTRFKTFIGFAEARVPKVSMGNQSLGFWAQLQEVSDYSSEHETIRLWQDKVFNSFWMLCTADLATEHSSLSLSLDNPSLRHVAGNAMIIGPSFATYLRSTCKNLFAKTASFLIETQNQNTIMPGRESWLCSWVVSSSKKARSYSCLLFCSQK